jgi:NAD(P)-dependent dehydrogenase (short-subunit alcohol dehydrogenase family)
MQTVLITGSSTGIGLATAKYFAQRDYRVIATARSPENSEGLQELNQTFSNLSLQTLDVCSQTSVDSVIAQTNTKYGSIQILVNNAGIGGSGSMENASLDNAREIMETNYFGALRMMKAVLPTMREAREGSIVNVSSQAGRRPFFLMGHYCASKYALNAASEALAHEVAGFGIRVAIIEPGTVVTPIFSKGSPASDDEIHYAKFQSRMVRQVGKGLEELGCQPEIIAKCIEDSVITDQPKLHYLVADDAIDNVNIYTKYGPEVWVEDGKIESDDEYFTLMKERYGYEIG